jgi:hypothetical protein
VSVFPVVGTPLTRTTRDITPLLDKTSAGIRLERPNGLVLSVGIERAINTDTEA